MLFNVLLFFFSFSFLNDHRSNNPFQVVYFFFSNKIYNLPIFENCLVFGYGLLSLYTL